MAQFKLWIEPKLRTGPWLSQTKNLTSFLAHLRLNLVLGSATDSAKKWSHLMPVI